MRKRIRERLQDRRWRMLHPTQRLLLLGLANGLTLNQLAAAMFWKRSTVDRRLAELYAKLGFETHVQAIAWTRERIREGVKP